MFIPILVILLSNLLAILGSRGKKNCLQAAFVILFLFIGFRYDYGNDTLNYAQMFQTITSHHLSIFNFAGIAALDSHEPGWVWLNYFFKPIGWFGFQMLTAAFELWVIYDCTKRYVPKEFQWLSVAIFTLNQGFMWIGACSMFRQWFACILFLFSIRFILDKRFVPFLLVNLVCALCHKSAIVVFPAYLFGYLNLDFLKNRLTAVIILVLIAVWYSVAGNYFGTIEDVLIDSEDFSSYLSSYTDTHSGSYSLIGFVASFAMPAFTLLNINNIDKKYVPLIYISICSLLVTPLSGLVMMIGRLSTYFEVINLILYPVILASFLRNRPDMKYVVILMVCIILLPDIRNLFDFFSGNEVWSKHYSNYNSILGLPWQ